LQAPLSRPSLSCLSRRPRMPNRMVTTTVADMALVTKDIRLMARALMSTPRLRDIILPMDQTVTRVTASVPTDTVPRVCTPGVTEHTARTIVHTTTQITTLTDYDPITRFINPNSVFSCPVVSMAETIARLLEICHDLHGLHSAPEAQRLMRTKPLRAERRILIRHLVAKASRGAQ
jgi:hypothetical protein